MATINGKVNKIFENQRGDKISYALMVENSEGKEGRFSGWNKPACNEGDFVEFNAVQDGKWWNYKGDITVTKQGDGKATPKKSGGGGFAKGGGTSNAMSKAEWAEKDKQIRFQHAQKVGQLLVCSLVARELLPAVEKSKDPLDTALGLISEAARDIYNDIDVHVKEVAGAPKESEGAGGGTGGTDNGDAAPAAPVPDDNPFA